MHLCALCCGFTAAASVLAWAVQGAITMAIFGSGMNKEYAFFGYEGDFVRCAVALLAVCIVRVSLTCANV